MPGDEEIYKGLALLTSPTGNGGLRLRDALRKLADRTPNCNFAATTNPTASSDVNANGGSGQGFYPGSKWYNNNTKKTFECLNNSPGAAVWVATGEVTTAINPIFADIRDFGAKVDGTTNDAAAFTSAVSAVGTNGGVIVVPPGTCRISTNLIIPNGVVLRFAGGKLSIDFSITVTILGKIEASPKVQIFSGSGLVSFRDEGTLYPDYSLSDTPAVYPHWWGAKGDGIYNVIATPAGGYTAPHDDTLAFQKCIDAATKSSSAKTVKIPVGIYKLSAPLILTTNFGQVAIEGDCNTYQYYNRSQGVVLYQSNPNVPLFIVQCSRGLAVRKLMLWGANNLGGGNGVDIELDMDLMLDPDYFLKTGVRNKRYSPHAAIALDPFADLRHGTGTITSGSNQITGCTGTWANNQTIAGVGIPADAKVTAFSGTTATIDTNATASGNIQLYRGFSVYGEGGMAPNNDGSWDTGYPGNDAYGTPLINRYVVDNNGSATSVFEDVTIQHFAVGVAFSLGGNGNCSEMQFTRIDVISCHTGFAFGYSQSRSIIFENCLCGVCYVCYDTINYGVGNGSIAELHGCGGGWSAKLFNINTSSGHLLVDGFYCEGLGSLGFVGASNSALPSTATFVGCAFNFAKGRYNHGVNDGDYMPDFILSNMSNCVFVGCNFWESTGRYLAFNNAAEITFNGCNFATATSPNDPSMCLAFHQPNLVRMIQCKTLWAYGNGNVRLTDQFVGTYSYNETLDGQYVFTSATLLDSQCSAPVHLQGFDEWIFAANSGYPMGTATVTPTGNGAGTVTFTQGDANLFIRKYDLLYNAGTGGGGGFVYQGWRHGDLPGSNQYGYAGYLPIGVVENISLDGRTITLSHVPWSVKAETGTYLGLRWYGQIHERSTGVTTSGSNQITSVTNVSSWQVDNRIRGTGIPQGAFVKSVSGTTLTISTLATASGTTNLTEARVGNRTFDAPGSPPANGNVYYRVGDRAWNTAPATSGSSPAGWICVSAGLAGAATWRALASLA